MKKTIGIIGGMGPMATCDLMKKIFEVSDADCDQNYVHVCVDCNTNIPDRTKAILENGEDPIPEMVKSAVSLQNMGADLLMIPCNTAHFFYDRLKIFTDIPILHMPRETVKALKEQNISCAAVLATDGVIKSGVYEKEQQQKIMAVIYQCIKAGKKDVEKYGLDDILKSLIKQGAQSVILGCTELPIAFSLAGIRENIVDPTEIAARAALKFLQLPIHAL